LLAPRGDEFAIILDNCAEERALLIGNQLLKAPNSLEIEWQSANYAIGASIGLAVGTMDMGDAQAWLEAADGACYIAKRTGLANSEARHARKTMCSRSSKGRELLLAADSDRAPWSRSLGSKVGAPGWWMMVRTHPCVDFIGIVDTLTTTSVLPAVQVIMIQAQHGVAGHSTLIGKMTSTAHRSRVAANSRNAAGRHRVGKEPLCGVFAPNEALHTPRRLINARRIIGSANQI
jgi:hypothetical protein